MKSLLLAAFAIGVPLGLMLVINWAMSGAAPVATPQVVAVNEPTAGRAKPEAAAPAGDLAREWPVELVPAGRVPPWRETAPRPDSPRRHGDTERTPVSGEQRNVVSADASTPPSRPATAPATDPTLADRIEDWLEDWRLRVQQRPDSRREAAALALARGEFERAATAFDRLLLESPKDADLIMGEVMALTRLGRYEDALPLLAALLERDPKNTAARYHQGVTLTRLDRGEEAIAAFSQLLEVSPGHGAAMFNLAVLQQAMGRRQEAWATWRKLTEQLSERPASRPAEAALGPAMACAAWFHRGEAEMAMSQVKEAQKCFLEVTRRSPDDARAWCNLGIARAVLAEYDDAEPALMAALRLEPTLVAAMNQLAYIHAVRYRDTRLDEDRKAVLDWCARSLAVRSQQPNIHALINAVLEASRQPEPDEDSEEPAGDEPTPSPIDARP